MQFLPRLIAIEITRRCHMNCKHCRTDASDKSFENELSLNELKDILQNISTFSKPIIILTGGEPLLRKDIYDIAAFSTSLSLYTVLATCGKDIDEAIINRLKESGIKRISLSIDGSTSNTHDDFRGISDSFDQAVIAAKHAFNGDLPFQINTTVTKQNMNELEAIIDLSIKLKAVAFHPFFLVPTGRAKKLSGLELNADEYEKSLTELYEWSKTKPIEIKPTCAPQYHRIAGIKSRACLAGTGFAFISHTGKVQTCGFLDLECGDLRKMTFENIWNKSEIFNMLRDNSNYEGQCGRCRYIDYCGGCRARAHEINRSYLGEEPYCNVNRPD